MMAQGFIVKKDKSGQFGYIDSPELGLEGIIYYTKYCRETYKYIRLGDNVSFKLVPSDEHTWEATQLRFIHNANYEELRKDFISKKTRWGYLKQTGGTYSVKDLDTHLFFRLQVVDYECNLKEVYDDHIDELIPYQITFFSSDNKIRCINLNRQFLPECRFLVVGNTTEGIVKKRVNGGYQIEIYTTILGFLPNSFAIQSSKTLQIGDVVQITCVPPRTATDLTMFDLTENYNAKMRAKKEQEEFFERLKPGDVFQGTVASTAAYGVFVNIGKLVALLHMRFLVSPDLNYTDDTKFNFSKAIKRTFQQGKTIDVCIAEISEDRVHLCWDATTENNAFLNALLRSHYGDLCIGLKGNL